MKIKRIIALIFAVVMITAQICMAAPATGEAARADHLTVGNPNSLQGSFFTDMWSNVTSDQDVRSLLHAYNVVRWDGLNGLFTHDQSVVTSVVVTENTDGDRTYTFVLRDDLYYSDGTRITAWDYAFSILLQIAPEVSELGGTPDRKPQILGYENYINGTVPYLEGVRVGSDYSLSITIDHNYLPFFYETALVSVNPYPISVIAPGVEVRDDGRGVYLANIDNTITEPIFTAALLEETIMDPQTGYRSHPSVVSGPYILTSWDGETADFEINEYYKGNYKGETPTIQTLTFSTANNETMIQDLKDGEYDLLNKVMSSDAISAGMTLTADSSSDRTYSMSNYPRNGMSYISFACEKPALAQEEVRQAIAWCMDRDAILADYVSFYGMRVDGYYGVGQWLYGIINGTVVPPVQEPEEGDAAAQADYEAAIAAYDELSLDDLTAYSVDIDKANELLDSAGWTLNADGIREKTVFVDASTGALASSQDTANVVEQTVTLELTLAYTEGSKIAQSFEEYFIPYLEETGIKLTLVPMSLSDLLTQFCYPEYREADMFFLASNLEAVFDPSSYFTVSTDASGRQVHTWVSTGLADEELYNLTVAMRETQPGDVLTYCQNWLKFQTRFNEVLPMLPIYSNIYFDFYEDTLKDYEIGENTSWADAIVSAYLSVEPETQTFGQEEGLLEFND